MQVIIPLAGRGTRLLPHTHTKAKPLIRVAGKPVLSYILDPLKKAGVKEVIFIIGYLGEQVKDFVMRNYDFDAKFVVQKELKGQAHAIRLAEKFVHEDVLIWFSDTISNPDLKKLQSTKNDGLIFVKEHPDPERFGVVFPDKKGIVKKIIEKPKNPSSNLVNIGLYYVKNHKLLFNCIDELIKRDMQLKGEFYLVDALNLMIGYGSRFDAKKVSFWEDCGKPETLLQTNRFLLKTGRNKPLKSKNSLIIEPVHIEDNVLIMNSIIGPNVTVARNSIISNSIVKNSLLGESSCIEDAQLDESIVGSFARVKGFYKRLNIGDHSKIIHGRE
ncbi:MAG: sugar phosphate nucleotidyltransferase [Nanoarchaeota archaeon]|nr:NTP transferase domain-containing protein [Nanoarchaeota archaeon]MBU1030373.1 NTP transferase domain-containing protein [Nanoarchaeota archaeon]MBU1850286.1 NTP transferase domain-containing protein [Nanoarchaeota archaeon]